MDIRLLEDLKLPGPHNSDGTSAASPKNQAKIEPLYAPEMYASHYDGKKNEIMVGMKNGDRQAYELYKRIDDKDSSFAASVMLNKDTGHAIILYKGMDLPGRDEGSGRTGFIKDYEVARAARLQQNNIQTPAAEKAYLDTLNDPKVKSLEIVGYSIGSLHLNTMAAKHGAKGTAIADMGISDSILTSVFNKGVSPDKPVHSMSGIESEMRDRVTSLKKEWDIIPASHAASEPRGNVIKLDQDIFSKMMGIAHIPQVYESDANKVLKERSPASPAP